MKHLSVFLLVLSLGFISGDGKTILGKHEERVHSVAFNHSSTLMASGSNDNKIMIWDVKKKELKHSFVAHSIGVKDLVFTTDGQWLVSAGLDGVIIVWNTSSWKREKTLTDHSSQVLALAVSDDGKYLFSGGDDKRIFVYSLPDFKKIKELPGHSDRVLSLTVSANNKYLASTGGDRITQASGNLKIWKIEDWSLAYELEEPAYAIQDAALSSGGTLVLYGGNFADAVYYKWTEGKVAAKKKITDFGINGLALSGTTAYLGCSFNGKLVEWDMKTGDLKELNAHDKDITTVAISGDNTKLATAGINGNVILWNLGN